MKSSQAVAAILGSLVFCAAAQTSPGTVFGLSLGEAFQIPECPKETLGRIVIYAYARQPAMCFQRGPDKITQAAPLVDDTVTVQMPISSEPSMVAGFSFIAHVLDGKLEGIGFNTFGYASQDRALASLTEKYGPPDAVTPKTMRNGFGKTFEAFNAIWVRLPGIAVTFDSVTSAVNSGLVTVDTSKGLDARSKAIEKLLQRPAAGKL